MTTGGDGWAWDGAKYLAVALIVGSLLWFAYRYARWITTNFVVTSDRLVYRSGLIAKQGIEIPLERVNTVFFNQGVFERMLGAGDLSIESGGETGKQNFRDIRRPSAVQNEIYKQMELNNTRMYGAMGHQAPRRRRPPTSPSRSPSSTHCALRAPSARPSSTPRRPRCSDACRRAAT